MDLLERGQACTGWFDSFRNCNWSEACANHDNRYMYMSIPQITRLQADKELFFGVWKICKPMAIIMFIGVRCFGWYYWKKYERQRNGTQTN